MNDLITIFNMKEVSARDRVNLLNKALDLYTGPKPLEYSDFVKAMIAILEKHTKELLTVDDWVRNEIIYRITHLDMTRDACAASLGYSKRGFSDLCKKSGIGTKYSFKNIDGEIRKVEHEAH